MRPASNGGFEMVNSKRRLNVEFAQSGVAVHVGDPKGAGWDLALEGYGRGKSMNFLSSAAPQANANRVEYHRGDLTEWYVNGPVGLEQGFTLVRPPRLAEGHIDQPLTIALTLSGDLTASLDSAGTGLTLKQRDGEAVLRYTGLSAQDAAGERLKCWLELHGNQLLLRINDAGARYPVVVDPFMQVAELSVTGGPGYFGLATAISDDGRVVVVGACGYDAAAVVIQRGLDRIQFRPLPERLRKSRLRINILQFARGLRLLGQLQFHRVHLRIAIGANGQAQRLLRLVQRVPGLNDTHLACRNL